MPRPWLAGVERRTNEDIRKRLGVEQIYSLITPNKWPYKTEQDAPISGDITCRVLFLVFIQHRYYSFITIKSTMRLVTKPVVYMSKEIKGHRLGAFIYGFLCGSGLIMFICGIASIVMLPSLDLMINIGLTLIGVLLFACGSCCEAYLRGSLTVPSRVYTQQQRNQPETTDGISTQIIESPAELEEQKTHAS